MEQSLGFGAFDYHQCMCCRARDPPTMVTVENLLGALDYFHNVFPPADPVMVTIGNLLTLARPVSIQDFAKYAIALFSTESRIGMIGYCSAK